MKKFNESFSFVSKCDSLERDRLKFLRSSKRRNGITKDGVSNGTIQPRGKIGFGHGPFFIEDEEQESNEHRSTIHGCPRPQIDGKEYLEFRAVYVDRD